MSEINSNRIMKRDKWKSKEHVILKAWLKISKSNRSNNSIAPSHLYESRETTESMSEND